MHQDFEALSELTEEHGDSFYLIDVDRFRRNLRALSGAFRALYRPTLLGYSYKTNYTPVLCRIADEEGHYAEVVSKTEYDLAMRLGVSPKRVIFNGPLMLRPEIEEALLGGAIVNLDSAAEIGAVESIAHDHSGAQLRVGLRCNLSVHEERNSRFGFAGEEIGAALSRLRAIPNCEVQGLHCHSSDVRDPSSFERRIERLIELAGIHFADAPPAMLDVGGGFYGNMPESLREQFVRVPSFEDYAESVASPMAAAFPGTEKPTLVLEPGVSVVANAVSFVARVEGLKRLGNRRLAITTGSVQNVKSSPNPIRLPVQIVGDKMGTGETLAGPIDIAGYTCMERDILYPGYPGTLRVGDFVVFSHVGAYTNVFKPPFIRPAPAMLAWAESSASYSLARRAERLDDLLATYAI